MEADLAALPTVCYVDPASCRPASELKRGLCRSAIVVCAYDDAGRIFPVYSWAKRCRTDELVEQIFEINEEWQPMPFGIEGAFMQALYADTVGLLHRQSMSIGEWAAPSGKVIPVTRELCPYPVDLPRGVDKKARVRAILQPALKMGRLIFHHSSQRDLIKELTDGLGGRTVDLLDALSQCVVMVPQRQPYREREANRERYAQRLRDEGVRPREIERAVREREGWREPPPPTHAPDGRVLDPFERKIAALRAQKRRR